VEPIDKFPLLQDDYKIPCDKEKLCDHASLISITQLVHRHDTSILDDTHAEVRCVHCIDSEKEEFKFISSLNCLGIEFDFVCDLNSLKNELFQKSGCYILIIVLFIHLVYMTITIATLY
jgi:hypothetical protein